MEKQVIERAKRQRFTSILCRYPRFMLETDEDDKETVREFERRLEWERNVLQRKDGFENHRYNLYRSEDFGPGELIPDQPSATSKKAESYKNLCPHHSTGKSVQFQSFVQKLSKTISSAVKQYEKAYPHAELCNISKNAKLGLTHNLVHFNVALGTVSDCISDVPLTEFFEKEFESSIVCTACKLSACVSDITTVTVLIHLAEKFPENGLTPYLDAIMEQVNQWTTAFPVESLAGSVDFLHDVESRLERQRPSLSQSRRFVQAITTPSTSVPAGSSSQPAVTDPPASKYKVNLPVESSHTMPQPSDKSILSSSPRKRTTIPTSATGLSMPTSIPTQSTKCGSLPAHAKTIPSVLEAGTGSLSTVSLIKGSGSSTRYPGKSASSIASGVSTRNMADKGTQAGPALGFYGNMVDKGTQTRPIISRRAKDSSHFSQNRALHGNSSPRKRDQGKVLADF